MIEFELNGRQVTLDDDGGSLLDALRGPLQVTSVKDGCSPQGQCGCCTVLVDGTPRVACVTPLRRVASRSVTSIEGLAAETALAWGEAFYEVGGSQCGFCTPGIICRFEALRRREPDASIEQVEQALLAHQCRCTGWQTICEAWDRLRPRRGPDKASGRSAEAAETRAALEGRTPQQVNPGVALGRGGFADDACPAEALVAVPDGNGSWAVGETLAEARRNAGKIQGRRTTLAASWPIEPPPGQWDLTWQTSWVEPAYLETDASWCLPGGEPASPLANGGAFGAKQASPVGAAARRLADQYQRPVRALFAREDVVRYGPKRPPLAAGIDRRARRISVRVARTDGVAEALRAGIAAQLGGADGTAGVTVEIEEVDLAGPPTSLALRAAGWAEGVLLACALLQAPEPIVVRSPEGARAQARLQSDGSLVVSVSCGEVLDEVVLRSYCVGAAHMAAGWVCAESMVVDETGNPADLTIRSAGVLRAIDMPRVVVDIDRTMDSGAETGAGSAVNGSDAVFVAVAAELWRSQGYPHRWPTGSALRGASRLS